MRNIIPYNPKLKNIARQLRKNMTFGEIRLWKYLKGKQMCGYDFHRQKPIGNYIVDFFCNELQLAIEVDGSSHNEKRYDTDLKRQEKIESLGIKVIRFSEADVLNKIAEVVLAIESSIEKIV